MVRPAGWSGCGSSPPVLPSRRGAIIGRQKGITFESKLTRRIIARIEVGPMVRDTRLIVTNLIGHRSKYVYEKIYCARSQAENYIKSWKRHLASDRTSCSKANANQMRLMIHHCAYWLMWTLRAACPKRSRWRRVQFDTLRLHLIKIAATVVEKKTRVVMSLPASCPHQSLIRLLFEAIAPPHRA